MALSAYRKNFNSLFRIPFDPAGMNIGVITDRVLTRGWERDGFMHGKGLRVYRYKELRQWHNYAFNPTSSPAAAPRVGFGVNRRNL